MKIIKEKSILTEGTALIMAPDVAQAVVAGTKAYICGHKDAAGNGQTQVSDDNVFGVDATYQNDDRFNQGYAVINKAMAGRMGSLGLDGNTVMFNKDDYFIKLDPSNAGLLKQLGLSKYIDQLSSGECSLMYDKNTSEWIFGGDGYEQVVLSDIRDKVNAVASQRIGMLLSSMTNAIQQVEHPVDKATRAALQASAKASGAEVAKAMANRASELAALRAQYGK